MNQLTAAQKRGLDEYAARYAGDGRVGYLVEKDDDHDAHAFVRIFVDRREVAEVTVEGDGTVTE